MMLGRSSAQDTIVFHQQPQWKTGMNIASHTFFYEEVDDTALSFKKVKEKTFVPFTHDLQQLRTGNRPLIIQWLRFTIRNASSTDTIQLRLNLSAHYFTALYDSVKLIGRGGAYETRVRAFDSWNLPFKILPNSTQRFWVRTEDRQNQLRPPIIFLETNFSSLRGVSQGAYTDRYLFLLLAAMAGCLFFISLYALCQYYLYRDKAFIWYIAYTTSSLVIALFWMDIRHYLGLFSSLFHDLVLSVFLFLVPVLYSLFVGNILKLNVHFRKGWLLVKILMGVAILQMLIGFVTIRTGSFFFTPYYGYFVSVVPIILLHIVLLVLTTLTNDKVKWFLFAGLLSLLLLWCIPVSGVFASLPSRKPEIVVILIFPPAFLLLGLTIEAICFAFALSYRSKLVLVEKNNLQEYHSKDLAEKLDARTKELEVQRIIREEQTLKQVQTDFDQRIAAMEMTALRAQMNPHFIFNCLNSIKLYTLENDAETAAGYLTIFSQLIRLVLENSRSEKVTLHNELETLRLYIELEAMRFKNKVRYEFDVEASIDQQYIEIPPLLIQPYVENAIWHGLMHKKEGGTIRIAVTQPSGHLLQLEITDDGVGREMAAAYKSKSATRQKSFGLKMTEDRLQVIHQLYSAAADVEITDLRDENGHAAGTKVVIRITV